MELATSSPNGPPLNAASARRSWRAAARDTERHVFVHPSRDLARIADPGGAGSRPGFAPTRMREPVDYPSPRVIGLLLSTRTDSLAA